MITTNINKAITALTNEDIAAIPTETVYGLAGNIYSEIALNKIFTLKKRPFYNPLIVHLRSQEYLQEVALDVPQMAVRLAEAFWPGPLTLVLKKNPSISDLITAGKDTVAVRVPNHPLTLALLKELEFPLAAPSANPFGSVSPTTAEHVEFYFKNILEVILDGGACHRGIESTIIGFENNCPVLYRYGSISAEEIEKVIGNLNFKIKNEVNPNAPGMISKHYAPATKIYLTRNVPALVREFPGKKIGVLLFKNKIEDIPFLYQEILSPSEDLNEAAGNLYAALIRLDNLQLNLIIAELLPDKGLGKTINDRLGRAIK